MTTINKPVHEIRLGSVRAAIWANITQNGVRHSVTISRSYRVGNDWKKTNSYGKEDLLVLEKITELLQPTRRPWCPMNRHLPLPYESLPCL